MLFRSDYTEPEENLDTLAAKKDIIKRTQAVSDGLLMFSRDANILVPVANQISPAVPCSRHKKEGRESLGAAPSSPEGEGRHLSPTSPTIYLAAVHDKEAPGDRHHLSRALATGQPTQLAQLILPRSNRSGASRPRRYGVPRAVGRGSYAHARGGTRRDRGGQVVALKS